MVPARTNPVSQLVAFPHSEAGREMTFRTVLDVELLVTWHTVKFTLGRSVKIDDVENGRSLPSGACPLLSWPPPCQVPEPQRLVLALEEHFAEWPPPPWREGAWPQQRSG